MWTKLFNFGAVGGDGLVTNTKTQVCCDCSTILSFHTNNCRSIIWENALKYKYSQMFRPIPTIIKQRQQPSEVAIQLQPSERAACIRSVKTITVLKESNGRWIIIAAKAWNTRILVVYVPVVENDICIILRVVAVIGTYFDGRQPIR